MLADVIGPDLVILLVVYLAFIALFVVAWVQILSKAGHSGWWVLIGIVPLAKLLGRLSGHAVDHAPPLHRRPRQEGVGRFQLTQRAGLRWSTVPPTNCDGKKTWEWCVGSFVSLNGMPSNVIE